MQKFKSVYKFIRFGLMGVMSTAFYFLVSLILNVYALVSPIWAHIIAFCLSIPLSYCLQQGFTFKYLGKHSMAALKFTIVNIVGFSLGSLIVLYIEKIGYHPLLGTGMICVTLPLINFLLFDLWVFKN